MGHPVYADNKVLHEEFKFRLKYQSLDTDIDIDLCQQENFYNFRPSVVC